MKEINLKLTVEEVNQILDALGDQPFKSVFNLIGKIQNQAGAQLQEKEPTPAKDKSDIAIPTKEMDK